MKNNKKEEIKKFIDELKKEKAELIEKVKKIERGTDFGDDVDGFEEEADEAEELSLSISKGNVLRTRIMEIDSVISDTQEGKVAEFKKWKEKQRER